MQLSWLVRGLRTGVVTTRYPRDSEELPTGFRGRPVFDSARCRAADGCNACVSSCLPGAISLSAQQNDPSSVRFSLNYAACIMCGLCVSACPEGAMGMSEDFELATRRSDDLVYATNLVRAGGVP